MEPRKERNDILSGVERILDRGVVINADILVSVAGVELLGIKLRAALASFETAARYGLAFPMGTDLTAPAWLNINTTTETCPQCQKKVEETALLEEGCPWCGWIGAKALRKKKLIQVYSEG